MLEEENSHVNFVVAPCKKKKRVRISLLHAAREENACKFGSCTMQEKNLRLNFFHASCSTKILTGIYFMYHAKQRNLIYFLYF